MNIAMNFYCLQLNFISALKKIEFCFCTRDNRISDDEPDAQTLEEEKQRKRVKTMKTNRLWDLVFIFKYFRTTTS